MSLQDARHWATPRHRHKAWTRGDITASSWLTMTAVFASAALYVVLAGRRLAASFWMLGTAAWTSSHRLSAGGTDFAEPLRGILWWLAGFALAMLTGAAAAGVLQTRGALWTGRALPDWERLVQFRRLAAWREGLLRAAFGALFVLLPPWLLWTHRGQLAAATLGSLQQLAQLAPALLLRFAGIGLLLLAAVAVADFGWQAWRRELRLRMTDEQLRDEDA